MFTPNDVQKKVRGYTGKEIFCGIFLPLRYGPVGHHFYPKKNHHPNLDSIQWILFCFFAGVYNQETSFTNISGKHMGI